MASVVRMVQCILEPQASKPLRFLGFPKKSLSTLPAEPNEVYPLSMKFMHWGVATGVLGCFGTVQAAQRTTKEQQPTGMSKGELMNLHKSFGLLVGAAMVPRVLLRLGSTIPPELPGHTVELIAAKIGASPLRLETTRDRRPLRSLRRHAPLANLW